MGSEETVLPRIIMRRLRREAEKLGVNLEEYPLRALSQSLDPRDRAIEYVETAKRALSTGLVKSSRMAICGKLLRSSGAQHWAIKAYTYWRENKRLLSYGELWDYKSVVTQELGRWVYNAWNAGRDMWRS